MTLFAVGLAAKDNKTASRLCLSLKLVDQLLKDARDVGSHAEHSLSDDSVLKSVISVPLRPQKLLQIKKLTKK